MLSTGYLPILGGGVETGMPQVLLEQSQTISRIVKLHSVDSEAISQPMGAYIVTLTSLRVYQLRQSCFLSTVANCLPCPMAVDAKYKSSALLNDWATAAKIVSKQAQSVIIQGQYPLFAVFLLLD